VPFAVFVAVPDWTVLTEAEKQLEVSELPGTDWVSEKIALIPGMAVRRLIESTTVSRRRIGPSPGPVRNGERDRMGIITCPCSFAGFTNHKE
jgi:hypothetical protein